MIFYDPSLVCKLTPEVVKAAEDIRFWALTHNVTEFGLNGLHITTKEIPMDQQHTLIKGYRDLSQEEINLMNKIKQKAEEVRQLCEEVGQSRTADGRWMSIATTDLQKGFMSLVRSVARPTTF